LALRIRIYIYIAKLLAKLHIQERKKKYGGMKKTSRKTL